MLTNKILSCFIASFLLFCSGNNSVSSHNQDPENTDSFKISKIGLIVDSISLWWLNSWPSSLIIPSDTVISMLQRNAEYKSQKGINKVTIDVYQNIQEAQQDSAELIYRIIYQELKGIYVDAGFAKAISTNIHLQFERTDNNKINTNWDTLNIKQLFTDLHYTLSSDSSGWQVYYTGYIAEKMLRNFILNLTISDTSSLVFPYLDYSR